MITTSATYNTILANSAHSVEWQISVNGVQYGMDRIAASTGGGFAAPHLTRSLFTGSEPSVGGCVAATFECTIFEASANVPRMAEVIPQYRLVLDGTQSEWITLGTFYIDTRSVNKSTGALTLSCYDRMLVADGLNGSTYADVTGFATWPQTMGDVASEIASIIGVTIDSRTVIHIGTGYLVDYPGDYTMREVLGYIAAAHCGNWTITPENKLRLVPLTGGVDTLDIGTNAQSLHASPALTAWSGVTVYYADEKAYAAGDDTGMTLTVDCPWATQDTANDMLAAIVGTQYQPFEVGCAFADLALELGDIITVGFAGETATGAAFYQEITADSIEAMDLSAPGEEEVDHEYPYVSYTDRSLRRKVTLGQAYYGVTISRDKGMEIKRSDGASEAIFNSDEFSMKALVEGTMTDRIYFDPIRGNYVFDGILGADAVFTDSIYAENGDVAEITVDRLSTSARIRKYILGNTSDDNYISIEGQSQQFISGTPTSDVPLCTESGLDLLTEAGDTLITNGSVVVHATNRYGQLLYWQRKPVSHDADGYPTDANGAQIYAGTEETPWPVYVYLYDDAVKAEFSFDSSGGAYTPRITLGAGDENGYNKATIEKSADGLDILFTATSGETIGLKALAAGYLDLYGLRKTTEMDFSLWSYGSFSETVDGNLTSRYSVSFDGQNRPVKITDAEGHETVVVW